MYYRQQLELCLKPRAVRPFVCWSVFSPLSTLSAIYQHVDKSFIKPLRLTWFPVDPCGWDHVHYLSILHCLLCRPHIRERRTYRSSFVILRLGSAGVPPLFRSRNSFLHLLHCVSPRSLQWQGQNFSWNTKWNHLPCYFQQNHSGYLSISNTHIYPPLQAACL